MRIILASVIGMAFGPGLCGQTNPCAETLRDGVRDYFQSSTYSSKFSSTKEYFKSKDFQEDVKKGRGALGQAPYVS